MDTKQDLPILSFASPAKWEEWLAKRHGTSKGLWLKIAKKGSGTVTANYAEALEIALCYGWIDGQKGALDETYFLQRFTPRGPRSKWSKINREKAEALIAAKKMKPAGLAEYEKAREDGRLEAAYEGQRTISVPDDLQKELDANPKAAAFFKTLSSVNRYAILYRIQDAKKPETRARRIEKFMGMLERGETVH